MVRRVRSSSPSSFSGLGLADEILATLSALGYEEPTPIQREAIPVLLEGRDLLGQAATGTGKTAAFALPMLQRIRDEGHKGTAAAGLVLVPTRELSMQVAEALHRYAKGLALRVVALYGGAPIDQQIRALARGAAIVVATPGRALDHLRRRTLVLEQLRVLVLDEADEMLDLGFAEDLDAIIAAVPAQRQMALFSATMPARIAALAQRHLQRPIRIDIAREKSNGAKLARVRQIAYVVPRAHKAAALGRVLDMENPESALVFCRTRLEVDSLVETLSAHGYGAEALHGGMAQRQRDRVMNRFRSGQAELMVATDVAARGLDIGRLSHVVNYDLPATPEAYVHRIGRTGRAGKSGTAITLTEPREHRLLRSIENFTRQKIEVEAIPTGADLRARRLELTRSALRERVLAGDLDNARSVVESLGEEFPLIDIAAAAVKLLDAALNKDNETADIPAPARPAIGAERAQARPPRSHDRQRRPTDGVVRLFVGAGRRSGMRPADLVGAITGEAGLDASAVGAIEIGERSSIVEVPASEAERIIDALRDSTLRGKKVNVRRHQPTRPPSRVARPKR
jgi:ATP-dependent RNA helicase DeaD